MTATDRSYAALARVTQAQPLPHWQRIGTLFGMPVYIMSAP